MENELPKPDLITARQNFMGVGLIFTAGETFVSGEKEKVDEFLKRWNKKD
jgi:hypothetical protein